MPKENTGKTLIVNARWDEDAAVFVWDVTAGDIYYAMSNGIAVIIILDTPIGTIAEPLQMASYEPNEIPSYLFVAYDQTAKADRAEEHPRTNAEL